MWNSYSGDDLFQPVKTWAEASIENYQILLGGGFITLIGGIVMLVVLRRIIGKNDERTDQIHLKSAYVMLLGIILFDTIFPKEYMWQIFFLYKYSFAFIAGGIYLIIRYKKEVLN